MSSQARLGRRISEYRVHLCFGPNCTERGSRTLMPILERAVREAGLSDRVEVLATTCRNRCDYGPSLNVYPGPVFYNLLDRTAIAEIVTRHLGNGDSCRSVAVPAKNRGRSSDNDLQAQRSDRVEGRPFVASVTVTHVPGTTYQTRIDTGDLALIGDEPVDAGGDGLGPNPYELLLAALGQCTVLTILLYARRKGWPVDGVSVRASHERWSSPKRSTVS